MFDWWEENYYEEHGEYDQFWDEWGDGGQDVGEFWSDVQDIWDSFWDWIDDAFGNEPYDDIYYEPSDHNYGCYDDWVTNGKKAESRTIRCEWYYVLDCGDEGGNWWDQFKDVVQCPECPVYEDYQEMFRDRLYAYWQETSLKIDFSHLYSLVSDACDGFAPDFEACVQRIYDEHRMTLIESFIMDYRLDYSSHIFAQAAADCNLSNNFSTCLAEVFLNGFLRVNPMLDLTEDEINWLVNRPDVVEELSNISERFTPETIDYFISVITLSEGVSLNDLIDAADDFANLDDPVNEVEEEEIENGIDILSTTVPGSTPSGTDIAANTSRGNTEDLQYGTNGNTSGIITGYLNKSDDFLFFDMDFLFNACAIFDGGLETVGDAFIERFRDRVGGDFHHSGLSASVMETNVMRNFIKKFGEELNLELENSNGDINGISIALGDTRPIFSSIYHQFHGLKILDLISSDNQRFMLSLKFHRPAQIPKIVFFNL